MRRKRTKLESKKVTYGDITNLMREKREKYKEKKKLKKEGKDISAKKELQNIFNSKPGEAGWAEYREEISKRKWRIHGAAPGFRYTIHHTHKKPDRITRKIKDETGKIIEKETKFMKRKSLGKIRAEGILKMFETELKRDPKLINKVSELTGKKINTLWMYMKDLNMDRKGIIGEVGQISNSELSSDKMELTLAKLKHAGRKVQREGKIDLESDEAKVFKKLWNKKHGEKVEKVKKLAPSIAEEYYNKQMSQGEASKKIGIDGSALGSYMQALGIPTRHFIKYEVKNAKGKVKKITPKQLKVLQNPEQATYYDVSMLRKKGFDIPNVHGKKKKEK